MPVSSSIARIALSVLACLAAGGTPAADTPAGQARERQCRLILAQLDAIDARMRLAYTASVGEKLRARQRRLQQQLWELRCRR